MMEAHDFRLGTEKEKRRRYKKYTYNDLWSAYLRGIQVSEEELIKPEWYTSLSSRFTSWHQERFDGMIIL